MNLFTKNFISRFIISILPWIIVVLLVGILVHNSGYKKTKTKPYYETTLVGGDIMLYDPNRELLLINLKVLKENYDIVVDTRKK